MESCPDRLRCNLRRKRFKALGRPITLAVVPLLLISSPLTGSAAYFISGGSRPGPVALLTDGKVLVAGNPQWQIFDPQTDATTFGGNMVSGRNSFTLTVLRNGKVLAVGGASGGGISVAAAEVFDPLTPGWSATAPLHFPRLYHTSTILPDGRVLIIGGVGSSNVLASAEIYDPVAGTWTMTQPMSTNRAGHVAVILPSGRVLVAGGYRQQGLNLNSAEIYDPSNGSWSSAGSMVSQRRFAVGCLLGNGKVLVAGGDNFGDLASAELFDPASQTWAATSPMALARSKFRGALLPNGRFFVAGNTTGASEIYDPTSGTWSVSASPFFAPQPLDGGILLPNGRVLIAGQNSGIYDPVAGFWSSTGPMQLPRFSHAISVSTKGEALVSGGFAGGSYQTACELYNSSSNTWRTTTPMTTARGNHTSTLLPNGLVLVAGGKVASSTSTAECELFNPSDESWVATGPMLQPRSYHSAILLPNGKVMVVGGAGSTCEIYDSVTGRWSSTGSLSSPRDSQMVGMLPDWTVVCWGGFNSPDSLSFELATGLWKYVGFVAGVWIPSGCNINGGLMCCGGENTGTFKPDPAVRVYNVGSPYWANASSMLTGRMNHRATLLHGGKVLVSGGTTISGTTNAAELNGPSIGIPWRSTGSMATGRVFHTSSLLPNGKVLVAGGGPTGSVPSPYAEVFDEGIVPVNASAPVISNITTLVNFGDVISITGSGFQGVSEASGGNGTSGASTAFPILQLYSLESAQSLWPGARSWSSNSLTSNPIYGIPPGYAVARLYVNGIPSAGTIILINPPAVTAPTLALAPSGPATNRLFQVSFTNAIGGVFGMFVSSNANSALSAWTPLGRVPEVSPGQFQFIDSQPATNAGRLYSVKVP
jgi:hypothetical protein